MRKLGVAFLALSLFAILFRSSTFAQQPSTSYNFTGLTSGVRSTSPISVAVDDFAAAWVNATTGSINVDATLTTSNTTYVYRDCNSTNGIYYFPTKSIPADGVATINLLGGLWPILGTTGAQWSGSLAVTSGTAFYAFSPNDFTVSGNSSGTSCGAYYSAWQNTSWNVPWYWNGTRNMLISPYGNRWHNDSFWDKGWQSQLSITNNTSSGQSTAYQIYYVSTAGSQNPNIMEASGSCSPTDLTSNFYQTPSISPGNSTGTITIDTVIQQTVGGVSQPSVSARTGSDGYFYVTLTNLIDGATPGQTVQKYTTTNNSTCPAGGGCPLEYSCCANCKP